MPVALDISVLKEFSGIFPFLLVMVLVYAVLMLSEWFKEHKAMAGIIALVMAFMTLMSNIAIKTINLMAPWFVLFVIFVILFMLVFMLFGFDIKSISKFVEGGEFGAGIWVMAIMIVIGLGSLLAVVNEEVGFTTLTGENATGVSTSSYGFWQTLFHPKLLGMVLVLLIAFFAIRQISKTE